MPEWLIALLVVLAVVGLLAVAISRGWLTMGRRGSFTGMTVYHDWASRDTQKGTEIIIERNAGKKEEEDETGEPDFEELMRAQDMKTKPTDQQDRS